jgi:SAM-dependent methyltransferase
MIFNEPTGYEDEPRELFEELPAELYSCLYHHERLNQDLAAEIDYYSGHLGDRCNRIVELGCGTCLLSSSLEQRGYALTGVDIDRTMLKNAVPLTDGRLAQMDMSALALLPVFEAALLAQNTLNLLIDEQSIRHCLKGIRNILVPPGLIMAHLHCSEQVNACPDDRLLQFVMFDHPDGGTVIKETIRSLDAEQHVITLEQRYKIRRFSNALPDKNYRISQSLAALSREHWVEIFKSSGFIIESVSSDFSDDSRTKGAALHLVGRLS